MPLALLGVDVGDLVGDAIRALVDLLVPDFGAGWVSRLVTWLVALPPVTGGAFPSLRGYARDLTAVGYGLLGACLVGGLLQLWGAGFAGGPLRTGEALRRGAIAAIALAAYPAVLGALLVVVNVLTAAMVRHPLVVDGLDKAFGEAFTVAAVSGGLSLGLAVGAAVALLYFVAALVVFKVGLTALLAVLALSGTLVWGLYPLPQASWLPRAWLSGLVAALVLPIAWACVFAAAALLARDTLVFDGGSRFNQPLGDALAYLVKPLATVACFWLAYKAPQYLLTVARSAGVTSQALAGSPLQPGPGGSRRPGRVGRYAPERLGARAVALNRDRFRALATRARVPAAGVAARASVSAGTQRAGAAGVLGRGVAKTAGTLARANAAWRALPADGARAARRGAGPSAPSRRRRLRPARSSPTRAPEPRTRTTQPAANTTTAQAPRAPRTDAPRGATANRNPERAARGVAPKRAPKPNRTQSSASRPTGAVRANGGPAPARNPANRAVGSSRPPSAHAGPDPGAGPRPPRPVGGPAPNAARGRAAPDPSPPPPATPAAPRKRKARPAGARPERAPRTPSPDTGAPKRRPRP